MIDLKTEIMSEHLYKHYLKFALSFQEREVATQIAKSLSSENDVFMLKDMRDKISIQQHSHTSAIITRLVSKGVLTRLGRGKYRFSDTGLVGHIVKEEQS